MTKFECCHCGRTKDIKRKSKVKILEKYLICDLCRDNILRSYLTDSKLEYLYDLVSEKERNKTYEQFT